jgi:hypothetical protein
VTADNDADCGFAFPFLSPPIPWAYCTGAPSFRKENLASLQFGLPPPFASLSYVYFPLGFNHLRTRRSSSRRFCPRSARTRAYSCSYSCTEPKAFFVDVFFNAHPSSSESKEKQRAANALVPTSIAYYGSPHAVDFAVDMGAEVCIFNELVQFECESCHCHGYSQPMVPANPYFFSALVPYFPRFFFSGNKNGRMNRSIKENRGNLAPVLRKPRICKD